MTDNPGVRPSFGLRAIVALAATAAVGVVGILALGSWGAALLAFVLVAVGGMNDSHAVGVQPEAVAHWTSIFALATAVAFCATVLLVTATTLAVERRSDPAAREISIWTVTTAAMLATELVYAIAKPIMIVRHPSLSFAAALLIVWSITLIGTLPRPSPWSIGAFVVAFFTAVWTAALIVAPAL